MRHGVTLPMQLLALLQNAHSGFHALTYYHLKFQFRCPLQRHVSDSTTSTDI